MLIKGGKIINKDKNEYYKDLIVRLRKETYWLGSGQPYSRYIHPVICDEAADAIELLVSVLEQNNLGDECFSSQNYNKEESQSYMDKVLEEQSKHLRNASNIIKPYYNKSPKDIPKSVLEQHTKEIQKAAKHANKCVDMLKSDKNRSKQ